MCQVLTFDSPAGAATELIVEGSTYGPEGLIYYSGGKQIESDLLAKNPVLNELSHNCCVCNDSKIVYDEVGCKRVANCVEN